MQRKFSLTRSEDYKRVRRFGKSYAHPLVVLVVQASDEGQLHVGVTASRNVGTAVERNRAKRLLREAMRALLPSIAPGWDIVLIGRPPLLSCKTSEVREALLTLLRRAQLAAQAPSDAA
ncbi:MAG: ribonuclease P protein component [Anaerolineae bacterium]